MHRGLVGFLILATTACGPTAPDPDGGDGGGDGVTDDGGDDGGGDGGDDGGGDDGGGDDGGGDDGGGDDGGGDSDSLDEACRAACLKLAQCEPDVFNPEDCIADCIGEWSGDPACSKPMTAMADCVAGLNCDQLLGDREFCADQEAAIPDACFEGGGDETCGFGGGGDPSGTECSVSEICPDYEHEMSCDLEVCVCLQDGQEVGRCASNGICRDDEALFEYFYECCEFP